MYIRMYIAMYIHSYVYMREIIVGIKKIKTSVVQLLHAHHNYYILYLKILRVGKLLYESN